MIRIFLLATILTTSLALGQQSTLSPVQGPPVIRLWEGTAPEAQGNEAQDIPTLTVYRSALTSSTSVPAVIVCPGGGYGGLATDYEGKPAQEFFNALGITVFVLKYRLGPRYHHPVELGDAQRAIRLVRARATEWGVDPKRVGIMGFSAGGHLASTASTHFHAGATNASDPIDRASSRPDFAVLVYPVISLIDPWTHKGSRTNLLGANPDSSLLQSLSSDRMVTPQTPPTFLFHTNGDALVPPENSVYYYLALRKAGVKAELHVFQNGPHGTAMGKGDAILSSWPPLLANWLRVNGWLP